MYGMQTIVLVYCSLAGIPTDSPNVQVWFEATPINRAAGVGQQGAPGQGLRLTCDASGGPVVAEWDVSMKMSWDTGPLVSVISSQGSDFLGDADRLGLSQFADGDYPWDGTQYSIIDSDGFLAETKGVLIPLGPGPVWEGPLPGTYTAFTTHLTANEPGTGWTFDTIDLRINALLWTLVYHPEGPIGPKAIVQFGDAPAVPGDPQGAIAEDIIVIQNIPEPSSAMLLVSGLLLLGRAAQAGRRRQRRGF
jgi:hypothetical protein